MAGWGAETYQKGVFLKVKGCTKYNFTYILVFGCCSKPRGAELRESFSAKSIWPHGSVGWNLKGHNGWRCWAPNTGVAQAVPSGGYWMWNRPTLSHGAQLTTTTTVHGNRNEVSDVNDVNGDSLSHGRSGTVDRWNEDELGALSNLPLARGADTYQKRGF